MMDDLANRPVVDCKVRKTSRTGSQAVATVEAGTALSNRAYWAEYENQWSERIVGVVSRSRQLSADYKGYTRTSCHAFHSARTWA